MKTAEKIKRLFIKSNVTVNPEVDEKILSDTLSAFERSMNTQSADSTPSVWRLIMKSKMTKFAAAAMIIVAVYVVTQIPGGFLPKAYALQDTIDAYNSIRWVHIVRTGIAFPETREFWLGCDDQGNVTRMRLDSDNAGDSIGSIIIAGNSDGSEAWLPKYDLHLTGYGDASILLGFDVSELDPKLLIERLLEQQGRNEVIVDIDEPLEKTKPIMVTVTYPEGSLSEDWKKVYYIEQASKLVNKIDKFKLQDRKFQHINTLELFDYNQPIDEMMFNLDNDVPAYAKVVDMTEVQAGISQGDMTDEEIAVEITRQFFEAAIARDFSRAGKLYLGAPGFLVRDQFMGANMLEILSVGQAFPASDPDSDAMICTCRLLAELDGQYYEVDAKMVRVIRSSADDGWIICGSSISVSPASADTITLSKDNIDLSSVTYEGIEPGEFMKKWLVLGPLPYPVQQDIWFASDEGQQVAFDTDSLNLVNFAPKATIDNVDYEWSILESKYGSVDLTQLNEEKNDFQIVYLWAQVDMPEETEGLLGVGSDDGVKVWLNGELVHENWLYRRGVVSDNDRVPVTFKKGNNQLVLKIQNILGPWGFCCRLLDESASPALETLTLSTDDAVPGSTHYDGLRPGELMQKWLLLEPIRIEVRGDTFFPAEDTQEDEFAIDQIDVTQFEPKVTVGEKDYQWSVLENYYGTINLTHKYDDWYLITYAWAQIDMPEEQPAVLGIGSDDGVKIWLNGKLVHENWIIRGVEFDSDRVPVVFKEGINQLVIKIQNRGGPWGFCCRLLDE
jgi:hypothetical protein